LWLEPVFAVFLFLFGLFAMNTVAQSAPSDGSFTIKTKDVNLELSEPAGEIVMGIKVGGNAADAIAAIQNEPALFNLSADSIAGLKKLKISSQVITAMLNHDAALRSGMTAPPRTALSPIPGRNGLPTSQPTVGVSPRPNASVGSASSYARWRQYWRRQDVPPSAPPLVLSPAEQSQVLQGYTTMTGILRPPWLWNGIQTDGPAGEDAGPFMASHGDRWEPTFCLDIENSNRGWSSFRGIFLRPAIVNLYNDIMLQRVSQHTAAMVNYAAAQSSAINIRAADRARTEAFNAREEAGRNDRWRAEEDRKNPTEFNATRRTEYAQRADAAKESADQSEAAAKKFTDAQKSTRFDSGSEAPAGGTVANSLEPFGQTDLSVLLMLCQNSSPARVFGGMPMTSDQQQQLQRCLRPASQ
jgi:hypothetical protein